MKMKKSIEIEIPDGKVEQISRDGDTISIKFVDVDICERVKTLKDAATIAKSLYPEIYNKWAGTRPGSYVEKLYAYRMVVAVLTNNEKNSLTTGNRFYPFVQFCEPDKVKKCAGNVVVGHIEEDGRKFAVVGGDAHYGVMRGSVASFRLTACRILMRLWGSGRCLPARSLSTSLNTLVALCLTLCMGNPTVIMNGLINLNTK